VTAAGGYASTGGGYGLFDGFEGYRTPSQEDFRRVIADGMIVVDANVLLNLYRYNEETRDDLLAVMGVLGERFWIPHQVLAEFWRNRESTLNTPRDKAKEAVQALEKTARSAENAIAIWAKAVALPEERHSEILEHLQSVFAKVCRVIEEQGENDTIPRARDTNQDALLSRLSIVLNGRVGPPLSKDDYEAALKEADRRAKAQEPPGYLDQDKDGDLRAGDYLVWEQMLREVARRKRDVLFVTSDVKEDWWRRVRDEARGPRLELQEEFRSRTQRQLYMLQPRGFLDQASSLLDVQISPESVQEVERVDRLGADEAAKRLGSRADYAGSLPSEARERVLLAIYRQAHEIDWEFLTNAEKTTQYRQWLEDPEVGGILLGFLPEQKARVWIKDIPMKEYARSQEGVGQYAKYAVMRFRGPGEIVQAACGEGWSVQADSVGEKPMHCYATDGTVARYICWGPPRTFRNLIGAALDKTIDAKERPAIVVTTRDGDTPITADERKQQAQLAERSGVDLKYLHRALIPNPEYVI
jgi:predicted nucleic acid-binding protein/alkylated DNA nucleotide flippase Atl1